MQFRRHTSPFHNGWRLLVRLILQPKSYLKGIYFFALFYFCCCKNVFAVIGEVPKADPIVILPIPEKTYIAPKKLSLRDAILLALRTNPNVRSTYLQRISDKFALEVAHNLYVPQYTFAFNSTFPRGGKPQYTFNPTATLLTPIGTKLSLNFNQSFLGGTGSGGQIVGSFTQPLLSGFGPTVALAPLEQAEYNEHTARLNLKNTVIVTVTQVIQNYYALVQAYNSLFVDQIALDNSLKIVEQYRIRIKAGQAAPLELAPQEAQLASQRLQVTQDQNAVQQAYQTLLTTLGLDPKSNLEIDKDIIIDTLKIPSEEQSTYLALENNVGYLLQIYQLKQDELQLLLARDANRWTLNFIGTKTIIPNAPPGPLTPSAANSWQLNLSIPINNKTLEQSVVNNKVILDQQKITLGETKRALRSEIITTIQGLQLQQLQIHQAVDAVAYAQQAYEVEAIKLRYGRSTVLNLTQLQTNLTQAKQSLISQQIAYINALAAFEATLGITLDKWDVRLYY